VVEGIGYIVAALLGGGLVGAAAVAGGVRNLVSLRRDREAVAGELDATTQALDAARAEHASLDEATKALQALFGQEQTLAAKSAQWTAAIQHAHAEHTELASRTESAKVRLQELMGRLDLYTRIDDFVAVGHFDMPTYLYETSDRFAVEIKRVREAQRDMIKDDSAVEQPMNAAVIEAAGITQKILKAQSKLMLRAFNIECDYLIEKVNPGNFERTTEQIEKLAEAIDKLAASLHCGLSPEYVELKFRECALQYQFKLRKAEEQEEQRLIREQMREEAKARAEYERAQASAEKEEALYERLVAKAREQALKATGEERAAAELKLADLEAQLASAVLAKERAKSMAEQTKRGHVYVISNVGSFGEGVYKIGLTRRLDPMERVIELGDASVPFQFDVHAFIYVEDAPGLEAELHRRFHRRRVNSVNLRKEFFRARLDEIRAVAEEVVGDELDFRTTIAAEEYFESRRLLAEGATV